MTEYPMTSEQEQEMRTRAQNAMRSRPEFQDRQIAYVLGDFVFQDGRLSDTVSFERRLHIVQEERLISRLVEIGAEDAEKWHSENTPKPRPPLGDIRTLD